MVIELKANLPTIIRDAIEETVGTPKEKIWNGQFPKKTQKKGKEVAECVLLNKKAI